MKHLGKLLIAWMLALPFAGLPVGCVLLGQPSDNALPFIIITGIFALILASYFMTFKGPRES